jgi:ATP phosphoribosyltransferase
MPSVDDEGLSCRLIRAQEISRYVELGVLEAGITGYDWIYENNSDVVEVAELIYAKQGMRPVRWVVAVPNESSIQGPKDLMGKRIATEAKVPELVDAIVELTETGSSLRANNLRIVDVVLESTTRLIANKKAWLDPVKRAKIEQLALLLGGALAAESRVLLKMNAPARSLDAITAILPALHAPTVMPLSDPNWHAVESVVEEKVVRDIIPQLRQAGAEGIIELPLNKVII